MPTKKQANNQAESPAQKEKLNAKISHRPEKEELVQKGIMKDGNVAPAIAGAKSELEKHKIEDTLKSHLANRVPKEDLVNQNILKADPTAKNAPSGSIQQAQAELQKRKIEDSLNKKLQTRLSEDDLIQKNILKAPVTVAPSLVQKQQELKRSQIEDTISAQVKKTAESGGAKPEKGLKKRPSEMMDDNVQPHSAKKGKEGKAK